MGDASVYDQDGNWYGLDVVPQVINDQVRVPAKFFQDAMGMSYVWDSVTNTVFMGSENTYNWLVNTYEYQEARDRKNRKDTHSQYIGTWYYTPGGDDSPLIELNISETNPDYIVAEAYRTHGKGVEYSIGQANFIDTDTAIAYGDMHWDYNGWNSPKQYRFTFYNNSIQMNIYDSDGVYEDTYNFYR